MVSGASKKAVQITVAILIALAVIGAYRGFRSSTSEADVATSDSLLPTANAVAARQASALQEAPPSMLSEAQIRTIARQEAQAALASRSAPASSANDDEPPSRPTPAPAPRPAPADRPAPAPAPQPAPPPAPAADGNQPPLF